MHMIPLGITFVKPNTEFDSSELQLLLHYILLTVERNSSLKNMVVCDIILRFRFEMRVESDFAVAELQRWGIKKHPVEPK